MHTQSNTTSSNKKANINYLNLAQSKHPKSNLSIKIDEVPDGSLDQFIKNFTSCPEIYFEEISSLYFITLKDAHNIRHNLNECFCYTNNHNRFKEGNTRTKIENHVIDFAASIKKNKNSLSVLSLGSGGLLQDLIIILKLIQLGFTEIKYSLIDCEYSELKILNIKKSGFEKILKKIMNLDEKIRIITDFYDSIYRVENEKFDILHAIDYDDYNPYQDFSSRRLAQRADTPGSESYHCSFSLVMLLKLMKSISFCTFSKGNDLFCYENRNEHGPVMTKYESNELKKLSEFFNIQTLQNNFDFIYLFSSIGHLFYLLDDLKSANVLMHYH